MQQVRYFLALTRTLSFTRAAEQCHVSQPALTRAIQLLEQELGGPLFHRDGRAPQLSELGRTMLPYLQQIHEQAEAAKVHARSAAALDGVTLRIGAMCTIGPGLIGGLIAQFRGANPGVDLELVDEGSGEILDRLVAGELHLALFGQPDALDSRLHGLPLFQERFVIAVPPDHALAAKNVVVGRDTHGLPYVSRSHCEYFDTAARALRDGGIRWRKVFSSPREDWVQAMIKAGLGIGFFPEFSLTDPGLVSRALVEPAFSRTIMLVTVRGRPHAPAVGAFIRAARAFNWPADAAERIAP